MEATDRDEGPEGWHDGGVHVSVDKNRFLARACVVGYSVGVTPESPRKPCRISPAGLFRFIPSSGSACAHAQFMGLQFVMWRRANGARGFTGTCDWYVMGQPCAPTAHGKPSSARCDSGWPISRAGAPKPACWFTGLALFS